MHAGSRLIVAMALLAAGAAAASAQVTILQMSSQPGDWVGQGQEWDYGPGDTVAAFRAAFEQHCEGDVPALTGEVCFDASVPVESTTWSELKVMYR
jgi:hypothetical protein